MDPHGWKIGSALGIELRVDPSWLFIAALITGSFTTIFAERDSSLAPALALAFGAGAALMFFCSVLLHEMAHAVMATSRGIPVESITLFLFGGVTRARAESKGARDELVISAVGPAMSLAIGAFLAGTSMLPGIDGSTLGNVFAEIARINVILAIFNLLPGLPLDGGRVFRAIYWGATGDLVKATRVAARAGRILGFGLVVLGVLAFVDGLLGGLWFIAIGWFLSRAATASQADVEVRHALDHLGVADLMTSDLICIPADLKITEAIDHWFLTKDHGAFPVTSTSGEIIGLLTLRDVRRVPASLRDKASVIEVATPLGQVATLDVDEGIDKLLEILEERPEQRVLVTHSGAVVGIISPRDIARRVRRLAELDLDRT